MTANTIHDTSQGKVSFFPFRIPISVVYDDFQTVACLQVTWRTSENMGSTPRDSDSTDVRQDHEKFPSQGDSSGLLMTLRNWTR